MANPSSGFRILGIDPGLNITGYGVLEVGGGRIRLVEAGVIRGQDRSSLPSRLVNLHEGMVEVIEACDPHCLAIEQLYSHYERPQTAILMSHARGVLCLAAAQANLPVHDYAATQIKKILTGNGRAPKTQMQSAVCHQLKLSEPPQPADVADALAIALTHHYLGRVH